MTPSGREALGDIEQKCSPPANAQHPVSSFNYLTISTVPARMHENAVTAILVSPQPGLRTQGTEVQATIAHHIDPQREMFAGHAHESA